MLADGDGLLSAGKSLQCALMDLPLFPQRKIREMGLGSLKAVGLAAARLKASECRALLADGIDPIAAGTLNGRSRP